MCICWWVLYKCGLLCGLLIDCGINSKLLYFRFQVHWIALFKSMSPAQRTVVPNKSSLVCYFQVRSRTSVAHKFQIFSHLQEIWLTRTANSFFHARFFHPWSYAAKGICLLWIKKDVLMCKSCWSARCCVESQSWCTFAVTCFFFVLKKSPA